MKTTITEALAELKTIAKRLERKRQFVSEHLLRPSITKDPLEADGGTTAVVAKEMQAIGDLETRIVAIRTAIQRANHATMVTVGDKTQSLAEWLTWRKEVSAIEQTFISGLRQNILKSRMTWGQKAAQSPNDQTLTAGLEVHVDEGALAKRAEWLETVLGGLDGQLSLKNATTMIDIAD